MEYLDPILGQTGCLKSSLEVQKFVRLAANHSKISCVLVCCQMTPCVIANVWLVCKVTATFSLASCMDTTRVRSWKCLESAD